MTPAPSFRRTLVAEGPRLLIESACALCGESKLVSHHDGSLERWETGHDCPAKIEPSSVPRPAPGRALTIVRKRSGSGLS